MYNWRTMTERFFLHYYLGINNLVPMSYSINSTAEVTNNLQNKKNIQLKNHDK